jgi:hypothetical protein
MGQREGDCVHSPFLGSLTFEDFVVRAAVSILILCCALWVIMSSRFKSYEKNWAFGAIGTILGYWLRP